MMRFIWLLLQVIACCKAWQVYELRTPERGSAYRGTMQTDVMLRSIRIPMVMFSQPQDDNDRDDYEEEDTSQKPYGNRSLNWTRKYRKLLPYSYARNQAMNLGLRSKEEWDEYLADGKAYHGPYLPSRPDEMYADDWVSWEEFLGLMRTHDDTRHIVQNILKLKDVQEYERFVEADTKRAAGLRIPYKPHVVYKDKGWVSFEHFFGNAAESKSES